VGGESKKASQSEISLVMLKTFLSIYLSEIKGMAWKGYINEK